MPSRSTNLFPPAEIHPKSIEALHISTLSLNIRLLNDIHIWCRPSDFRVVLALLSAKYMLHYSSLTELLTTFQSKAVKSK